MEKSEYQSIAGINDQSKHCFAGIFTARSSKFNERSLTQTILELLTHLNHSITDSMTKMSTARKETFTSAVGILNQFKATNERSIQTAINSEKSYLLFDLQHVCQRFLLSFSVCTTLDCSGERSDFGAANCSFYRAPLTSMHLIWHQLIRPLSKGG